MGYFGGISWAMLVARVCQEYPHSSGMHIVNQFFAYYVAWQWPNPIFLKPFNCTDYGFPVWNPKINQQDRLHLMPVITPAYPQQNSSYNITSSSFIIIKKKLQEGIYHSKAIISGKKPWSTLFEAESFFKR